MAIVWKKVKSKSQSDSPEQIGSKGNTGEAGGLSELTPEQKQLLAVLDKVLGLITAESNEAENTLFSGEVNFIFEKNGFSRY